MNLPCMLVSSIVFNPLLFLGGAQNQVHHHRGHLHRHRFILCLCHHFSNGNCLALTQLALADSVRYFLNRPLAKPLLWVAFAFTGERGTGI